MNRGKKPEGVVPVLGLTRNEIASFRMMEAVEDAAQLAGITPGELMIGVSLWIGAMAAAQNARANAFTDEVCVAIRIALENMREHAKCSPENCVHGGSHE